MMSQTEFDVRLRLAAVEHVRRISAGGVLTSDDLRAGFSFEGIRVPLINPQRGIFKPTGLRSLLSVRTVYPTTGRKVWYDDQRQVHAQIQRGDELVDYAFMGRDAEAADNRWLREAARSWSVPDAPERRYGLRLVRERLHQATFREAVLTAYNGRCAISGLPEPRLLDAAHIVADQDEELGQPVVPNGLPLSKVHHAAFDANLIGIDPDFRVHITEELLSMSDGPMFEHAIKAMAGRTIHLPNRMIDYPDRDRLAQRFERFVAQT